MTFKGEELKSGMVFLSMCRRNRFHALCHTAHLLLACMRSKRKDELQPSAVQWQQNNQSFIKTQSENDEHHFKLWESCKAALIQFNKNEHSTLNTTTLSALYLSIHLYPSIHTYTHTYIYMCVCVYKHFLFWLLPWRLPQQVIFLHITLLHPNILLCRSSANCFTTLSEYQWNTV